MRLEITVRLPRWLSHVITWLQTEMLYLRVRYGYAWPWLVVVAVSVCLTVWIVS